MSPPPADLSSSCYYGVLGVDKSATDADVTKAYRNLARKVHPDKRPDDRETAEEEFKKVKEAYDVLHSPEKRKLYDQFGKAAFEQGGGAAAEPGASPGGASFGPHGMGGSMSAEEAQAMFQGLFGGRGPNDFVFQTAGPAGPSGGGLGGMGDLEGLFGMFGGNPSRGFGGFMPTRQSGHTASPPHAIPSGTRAVVQGLVQASEHNGKTGIVVAWVAASGRYQVELDGGRRLSLRPESLVQRCRVEVSGLEAKRELNGRAGEIFGFDEAKARYLVLLDAPEAQVASLQPATCILPQGTRVVLQGLSTEQFNGQMAHIVSVHRDASRYTVQCQDRSRVKVKFENVRC